jgi:small subunit ribosomal protein S9
MADTQNKYYYGVGRRKTSTARAKYFPSDEDLIITVNKQPLADYFVDFYSKTILNAIKNLAITKGKLNLFIKGGGQMGQAEAGRLAITKSLVKFDEGYKVLARMHFYLTSDVRVVAPKLPGHRKNRKIEQWSKR